MSGLQQGHPESCRQCDRDTDFSFLSHTKFLLISLPWSTSGPFQHCCFPRVFPFHGISVFWIISPQNVPACIFPLWISFYFSSVFLSSLETFSHLHYFSDLPSSMSKLISLLSLTTSAAHLCLHRVKVLKQHMAFYEIAISPSQDFAHNTG